MGPIWVLSAPGRPHVGPMNLAIMLHKHIAIFMEAGYHLVFMFNTGPIVFD